MRKQHNISAATEPQYTSPLAIDLEGLSHDLMSMSESVSVDQWARLRLIIMQMRALADQVDGLLIPEEAQ